MSMMFRFVVIAALGAALSGCAVAEVGGAVIGAGATVAGAAVDVTTTVVGTAADTVTGGDSKGDDKNKDDKDGKKKPD